MLDGDPRFVRLAARHVRLDPYRNFERALSLVPRAPSSSRCAIRTIAGTRTSSRRCGEALGDAQLVYCDQRLVTEDGRVLRDSLWQGRRHDRGNLASLLVANTAPGAAMLFRRDAAGPRRCPFPELPGLPYHDHWLALVALAGGELAYVDRPLYDYVQHGGAVQGVVSRRRINAPRARRPASGSRGWRGAYFGGYVMRQVQAQTLLARGGRGPHRRASAARCG